MFVSSSVEDILAEASADVDSVDAVRKSHGETSVRTCRRRVSAAQIHILDQNGRPGKVEAFVTFGILHGHRKDMEGLLVWVGVPYVRAGCGQNYCQYV